MGFGVAPDMRASSYWARKAAEQGHAEAEYLTGLAYAEGQGVLANTSEAVKWFKRAASRGYAPAQLELGLMFARGDGVPQDFVASYKWFNLASAKLDQSDPRRNEAVSSRAALMRQMTPSQVAEAQRLTREWTPTR